MQRPEPSAARPRLLVTRPQAQAQAWVQAFRLRGIDALALPLLQTEACADPAAVRAAAAELPGCALAMFVSRAAVLHWRAALPVDWAWPAAVGDAGRPWAGATGPGTAAALREAGVPAEVIVSAPPDDGRFDSEALWSVLAPRRDWRGARVHIVRGIGGRDWLAQRLREAGALPRFVEVYRRSVPAWGDAERACLAAALARPAQHLWLFSSREAVAGLAAQAPGVNWSAARALATHPRIAAAAQALGCGQVDTVAPTVEAVAQWLEGPSIESPRP